MNLLDKTPKELFSSAILPKPDVDSACLDRATKKLPFSEIGRILGQGDWGRTRSNGGSVVVGIGENHIVKLVLGTPTTDAFTTANEYQKAINYFRPVSPETSVVIINTENQPTPAVLQEKVNGIPLCDVPLRRILTSEKIISSLQNIFRRAEGFYRETGLLDLGGLKYFHLGKYVLGLIPFLTDNIIVDQDDNTFLVDVTPDSTSHKGDTWLRKIWFELKLEVGNIINEAVAWNIEANKRKQKRAKSPTLAEQI